MGTYRFQSRTYRDISRFQVFWRQRPSLCDSSGILKRGKSDIGRWLSGSLKIGGEGILNSFKIVSFRGNRSLGMAQSSSTVGPAPGSDPARNVDPVEGGNLR